MPTKKTLVCPDKDCDYMTRRPVSQGMRGMKYAVPGVAKCPHGHGDLVVQVTIPRNRKPSVNQRTGTVRRYADWTALTVAERKDLIRADRQKKAQEARGPKRKCQTVKEHPRFGTIGLRLFRGNYIVSRMKREQLHAIGAFCGPNGKDPARAGLTEWAYEDGTPFSATENLELVRWARALPITDLALMDGSVDTVRRTEAPN